MKKMILGVLVCFSVVHVFGDGDELFNQGAAVFKTDPAQAYALFEQAAEEGNLSAMVGAGHCLENGIGTEVDYAGAILWYEKAVNQNNITACEGLARIYASCPDPNFHDGALAVEYAEVLARKKPKDSVALSLLAAAHARNHEFDKAIKMSKTAKFCADDPAVRSDMERMMVLYGQMKPHPFDATDEWILKAADQGAHWAIDHVVWRYCDSTDPLYNPEKGEQFCKAGIDNECMECWLQLGYCYLEQGKLEAARECLNDVYEYIRALPSDQSTKHYADNLETSLRGALSEKSDIGRTFDSAEKYVTGFEYSGRVHNDRGDTLGYTSIHEPPSLNLAYFLFKIAAKKGHQDALKRLKEYNDQIYAFRKLLENEQGRDAGAVAGQLAELAQKLELGEELPQRIEKALWIYRQAYAMKPSPQVAVAYARLLITEGHHDEAIASLEAACTAGNMHAHALLITIYACAEDPNLWNPSKAVEYALRLVESTWQPKYEAEGLLACAYARNGDFLDACKIMEQVLEQFANGDVKSRPYQAQYKRFQSGNAWESQEWPFLSADELMRRWGAK